MAGLFTARDSGQLGVVGTRQVPSDLTEFRGDQMKIVEQPPARARNELSRARVLGQHPVVIVQETNVLAESRQDARDGPAPGCIDGEVGGEPFGAFLELLEAE